LAGSGVMILAASSGGGLTPGADSGFFAFSETLLSAPDARAYFLLLRQKKVAKEKATPGSASGYARSLPLLGRPGGSTVLPLTGLLRSTTKKGQKPNSPRQALSTGWFSGPLGRCRATQGFADKGRALFEGQSPELRSPREVRVAQGTGAAGTDPGSPFLCLLSFGEAKESEAPLKGGKHSLRKPT